jgi:hypothetical protein
VGDASSRRLFAQRAKIAATYRSLPEVTARLPQIPTDFVLLGGGHSKGVKRLTQSQPLAPFTDDLGLLDSIGTDYISVVALSYRARAFRREDRSTAGASGPEGVGITMGTSEIRPPCSGRSRLVHGAGEREE